MNREELIDKMVAAIEKMKEETNKGVIKDYEKKYKEALEVAKRKLCFDKAGMVDSFTPNDIYEIFPELAGSEDGRIREVILKALMADEAINILVESGIYYEDVESWLEKQGEHAKFCDSIQVGDKVTRNQDGVLVNLSQLNRVAKKDEKQGGQKPVDKTEPKFKVGDIITNGKITGKVDKNENNKYHGWFGYDKDLSVHYADIPDVENWHLWTIQDAKAGDVVVDKSDGTIGIFQSIGHHPDGGSYNDPSYCFLHCHCDDEFFYADFENGNEINSDDLVPATKEQRDLLFQKMKEYGYEWDAEKKELKKIEQKPVVDDKDAEKASEEYRNFRMSCGIKDPVMLNKIEEAYYEVAIRKQKPAEWSEEDESHIRYLIECLEYCKKGVSLTMTTPTAQEYIDWLKSLTPQTTWKPSDEQMKALADALSLAKNCGEEIAFDLRTLHEQLKKLREDKL